MSDSDAHWRALRALLGELFELDAAAREARLAAVEPALAAEARALLDADAAHGGAASDRFERAVVEGAAEALSLLDESSEPAPGAAIEERSLAGLELGPWRLTTLLGRGGMAEVWEARRVDGAYEQAVAVKLLKRGMDSEEIVARFRRERQILARLEHPAIARLLDGGVAPDGRLYLVLEKVDGEPITDWCASTGAGLEQRLGLLIEVCEAVAVAHRQLVVHRDLKPSNILVDATGKVKLLDFGIAKLLDDDGTETAATRTEVRILTPAYAAPEQVQGEPVSTATDVYTLGVLAYELVTGRLPHRRPTGGPAGLKMAQLESAVAAESVPRPSQILAAATTAGSPEAVDRRRLARAVRGDLDTVLLTALQRDPARRYATVGALAEDLRRFLSGHPVAARPDTVGYRVRKFVGRHRAAVAASTLALATLVTALAVALVQAGHAAAQARRAERVQHFLIEVFRKSEPGESLGETLTAQQILADGVGQIDRQLAAEPEVAADLYDALAEIHQRLGLVPYAVELAERALALRERRLPSDPAKLGGTLTRLASLSLDGDSPLEAAAFAERAWQLLCEARGADSLEAAVAEGELAATLLWQERKEESVAHFRHAVEILRLRAGAEDARTGSFQIGLAEALEQTGAYEDAIANFREALPILARALGEQHPELSIARRDLAGLLDRVGRPQEAEPLLVSALAAQRKVLGNRHWQVGETLFSYGILLTSAGRQGEAEAAFREALTIDSPAMVHAHCRRYLGHSLAEQGRFEEAIDFLQAAVTDYRRIGGPDSVEGWRAVATLGYTHLRRGDSELAEQELRAAVARLEELAGKESYRVRLPLRQLGETLRVRGKLVESIAVLRRTRALEVKLFGSEGHSDIAVTDLQLARTLLADRSATSQSEAATLLDQSIELFRRHKSRSAGLGEALLERGRLRLDEGDAAAARADLEESADRLANAYGADHERTRLARELLSRTAS